MDAHVFRRLALALTPVLMGSRLEKIQSPAEHVFVLTFYAQKCKQHLILKASKRDPFLYLAKNRPTATAPPTAQIMRMRKYCAGRRIASCAVNWINRQILLLFRSNSTDNITETSPETWLILDLKEGLKLVLGSCPPLPLEDSDIEWPTSLISTDNEEWRKFPMLTPALRRTLALLDELDRQALLMDLQTGGGDIFVYGQGMDADVLAWPLPQKLALGRHEQVFEDPIFATTQIGDALVLGIAAEKVRNIEDLPRQREMARLNRLLQKLNDEELRLNNLVSMQELGLSLQNIMWKHAPDAKLANVETDSGELELDPRYTLSENMQKFFHKAGRGRRGLQYLEERRRSLQEQLQTLKNTVFVGEAANVKTKQTKISQIKVVQTNLPKGIEAFYSTDNFTILRGKDAKGNWAALRAASAHDLWLHVDGGPGAHCIIRRHFVGQEIPETTLNEAAKLAAFKSWQKDSPYAQIICAEVRHVKPMRGAAPGTVRIDKVWQSFRVNVEPDIELKLKHS